MNLTNITPLARPLDLNYWTNKAIAVLSFYVNGVIFYEGTVALTLAVAVMSSLFLVVIVDSRKVRAFGDQTAELLDPRRVQSAQVIALATAVLFTVWNGVPGMVSLMPLWAAVAGTSLYRFVLFNFFYFSRSYVI